MFWPNNSNWFPPNCLLRIQGIVLLTCSHSGEHPNHSIQLVHTLLSPATISILLWLHRDSLQTTLLPTFPYKLSTSQIASVSIHKSPPKQGSLPMPSLQQNPLPIPSPQQSPISIPSPPQELLSILPLSIVLHNFSIHYSTDGLSIHLHDYQQHTDSDLDPIATDDPSTYEYTDSSIYGYTSLFVNDYTDYSGSDVSAHLPPSSGVPSEVSLAISSDSDLLPPSPHKPVKLAQ